ncbi:hypothetical protein PENSPDRAFT_740810 [Peniophora sp. CONT]|nr:hypothetical protein PENSPDRAFT_740810 [Peniophora sp. CONT]
MSKAKTKQEEALAFLDDLDNLDPPPPSSTNDPSANAGGGTGGEADVLAFIDEITAKSAEPTRTHIERAPSRAGTPGPAGLRKSTERVKVGGLPSNKGASPSPSVSRLPESASASTSAPAESKTGGGGWGWGSVWSTASTAIQQARTVVDEQVKNLPAPEQAAKWREGVLEYAKNANLDKLGAARLEELRRVGMGALTDILNTVAPPISEHEVLKVWLSHDLQGYDGIESLAYKSLARVMEQIEGGDLVVNKGGESKPKENAADTKRDMQAVEGLEAALKLAQSDIEECVKANKAPESTPAPSAQNPTTTVYVYLRIQPYTTSLTLPSSTPSSTTEPKTITNLQFLLYLNDPVHSLTHTTITQAVPGTWLDVWDEFDWVEDLVAEALRVGVEVVGQEYIVARMGWMNRNQETAEEETPEVQVTSPGS